MATLLKNMSMGQNQKMAIVWLRKHIRYKNKDTLLSKTLKVGENKLPLFFCLVALFPRYGHFVENMSMGQNKKMAITQLRNHII